MTADNPGDIDVLIGDYLATVARYHHQRSTWPTKGDDWAAALDAADTRLRAIASAAGVAVPAMPRGHWSELERGRVVASLAARVGGEGGRALREAFAAEEAIVSEHERAWLPATWADVSVGTHVRRDVGDVGEVMSVEHRDHPGGYRLAVEVLTIDGQWLMLAVEPEHVVWVAIDEPENP